MIISDVQKMKLQLVARKYSVRIQKEINILARQSKVSHNISQRDVDRELKRWYDDFIARVEADELSMLMYINSVGAIGSYYDNVPGNKFGQFRDIIADYVIDSLNCLIQ